MISDVRPSRSGNLVRYRLLAHEAWPVKKIGEKIKCRNTPSEWTAVLNEDGMRELGFPSPNAVHVNLDLRGYDGDGVMVWNEHENALKIAGDVIGNVILLGKFTSVYIDGSISARSLYVNQLEVESVEALSLNADFLTASMVIARDLRVWRLSERTKEGVQFEVARSAYTFSHDHFSHDPNCHCAHMQFGLEVEVNFEKEKYYRFLPAEVEEAVKASRHEPVAMELQMKKEEK